MLEAFLILVALPLAGYLAFGKKLSRSEPWSAFSTPLASIMGSGFLISAPLLAGLVGVYALACMAGLLLVAYGIGEVMRYNIRHFEPIENAEHPGAPQRIALLSRIVLAGAYFISISYYLQLLSAFSLNTLGLDNLFIARIISSTLITLICGVGMWKGLTQLEKLEHPILGLNLGIIGALLVGLICYNLQRLFSGTWALPAIESQLDFTGFRTLLGLLIVVQGFEISRYLGAEHSADLRIKTMRNAQLVSAGIYLVFIALSTILFQADLGTDVTAIISMTKPVALVLPILLTLAALGSQFSAAVADTSGGDGLVVDLSNSRLPNHYAYPLILAVVLAITWLTDVKEIIAYASRAFAAFYFMQSLVATCLAKRRKEKIGFLFAGLAVISLAVVVLGLPSE